MADTKKVSELDAITAVHNTDLLDISTDAGGSTYVSKKITVQAFAASSGLAMLTFVLAAGTTLTAGVGKARITIPYNATILKAYIVAGTGPVGASVILDINQNGTSIWNSTPANRLTIADGSTTGSQTAFDTATIIEGDILTVDVDQVGTTTAGGDVTAQLKVQIGN